MRLVRWMHDRRRLSCFLVAGSPGLFFCPRSDEEAIEGKRDEYDSRTRLDEVAIVAGDRGLRSSRGDFR